MKHLLLLLSTCLELLLLAGCVAPLTPQTPAAATSTEVAPSMGATRTVTDYRGNEVEIPVDPQRIVVVDYNAVEELLALGITPVGILYGNNEYLAEQLADVPIVGVDGQPNLEMILQLKPDLIIAVEWWIDDTVYGQLGEIAPTVMIERQNFRDWKQYLRNMGELVGRSEQAEQLLAEYEVHVAQVHEAIGTEFLAQKEVSVFLGYENEIRIWVDSFCNTILNDVGIRIPQAQRDALPAGEERLEGLSLEQIPLLDADVIFSLATEDEWNVEFAKTLETNALWLQLPAVQAGKAYGVDAPWNEGSILTAHTVLDTLQEYLAP